MFHCRCVGAAHEPEQYHFALCFYFFKSIFTSALTSLKMCVEKYVGITHYFTLKLS